MSGNFAPTIELPMGKKQPEPPAEGRGFVVISFKAPAALAARIDAVCEGLGLDRSNLIRMLTLKNLHEFEAQVEELRKHAPPEGGPKKKS